MKFCRNPSEFWPEKQFHTRMQNSLSCFGVHFDKVCVYEIWCFLFLIAVLVLSVPFSSMPTIIRAGRFKKSPRHQEVLNDYNNGAGNRINWILNRELLGVFMTSTGRFRRRHVISLEIKVGDRGMLTISCHDHPSADGAIETGLAAVPLGLRHEMSIPPPL